MTIAIVGAGAAGLACAIFTLRGLKQRSENACVILLDGREKIGAKILMSGGSRCNVTHREVKETDFEGGARHFVRHALSAFTPGETLAFFKELGVELTLEKTGKYFPSSGSARTVLDALVREADRLGVVWRKGVKITQVRKSSEKFILTASESGEEIKADRVVLATGGLSHPDTGSDGTGLAIAERMGHRMVPTYAALTPFLTQDSDWPTLSGIALDVKLVCYRGGRKCKEVTGAMLFTHFGFSGPAVLDISRHWSVAQGDKPEIRVSFLPKLTEADFKRRLSVAMQRRATRFIEFYLMDEFGFPERFTSVFLQKAGIAESTMLRKLTRDNQKALVRCLFNYPLEVSGVFGFRKAEVTAGGVDLKDVHAATMESKKVPGLYFVGEILDVDGRIGGFNFQWSWSTAAIAGRAVSRKAG